MPFYVKGEKIYHYLNAFGLTPWMCLHLFYIMILYLYTWMTGHGYADDACDDYLSGRRPGVGGGAGQLPD